MTPPPCCRRLFNQREIHRTGREHTEEERLGRNRCCVYMKWNNSRRTAVVAPTTQKTVDKFKPRQVLNWLKKKELQGPTTGQSAENRKLQTALNGASISHLPFLIPFHTVHCRMDGKEILRARCGWWQGSSVFLTEQETCTCELTDSVTAGTGHVPAQVGQKSSTEAGWWH